MADQETESQDSGNIPDVVPPEIQEAPSGYPGPPPAYPGPPRPGYQSTTVQIVYIPYPVPQGEPSQSSRSSPFAAPPCPVKGVQYSETASMLPPDVQEFVSRYGSQYLTNEHCNSQTFVSAGEDRAQSQSQAQTDNEDSPRVVITSQQHNPTTTTAEQQRVDGKEPMSHLWLAVLVCCCCCPLIGAIAVGFSGKRISSGSGRGDQGGHGPPGPVKISHKKDDRQRQPQWLHVSWPPYPATGSVTVLF